MARNPEKMVYLNTGTAEGMRGVQVNPEKIEYINYNDVWYQREREFDPEDEEGDYFYNEIGEEKPDVNSELIHDTHGLTYDPPEEMVERDIESGMKTSGHSRILSEQGYELTDEGDANDNAVPDDKEGGLTGV